MLTYLKPSNYKCLPGWEKQDQTSTRPPSSHTVDMHIKYSSQTKLILNMTKVDEYGCCMMNLGWSQLPRDVCTHFKGVSHVASLNGIKCQISLNRLKKHTHLKRLQSQWSENAHRSSNIIMIWPHKRQMSFFSNLKEVGHTQKQENCPKWTPNSVDKTVKTL